jgi:thioredoxin-related protein
MKLLSLLFLLALAVVAAVPQARAGSEPGFWRSWNDGLREANESRRPVLVDVYTDWCGWCKRMDRDVYANAEVREYLNRRFVTVKLDAEAAEPARYQERSFTSRSLAAQFEITGYPTTLFLRANGEHLISAPGYIPADRFLLVLRYIGDGYLDRGVTWEDFKARGAK